MSKSGPPHSSSGVRKKRKEKEPNKSDFSLLPMSLMLLVVLLEQCCTVWGNSHNPGGLLWRGSAKGPLGPSQAQGTLLLFPRELCSSHGKCGSHRSQQSKDCQGSRVHARPHSFCLHLLLLLLCASCEWLTPRKLSKTCSCLWENSLLPRTKCTNT